MLTEILNYKVYNHTYKARKKIIYPKSSSQLIEYLKNFKKKNINPLIISGGCGWGDKSFFTKGDYIISLKKLKKIIGINIKKKIIKVESGVNLYDLFKLLQKKKYMIFNIPGGKKISIGGAIAGNVHGRPQSKDYATFGDNIVYIKYIDKNFKVKQINKKNIKIKELIGSFGLFGIIVEVGLKFFKLNSKTQKKIDKIVLNVSDFIKFDLENKSFYGYINYFEKKNFIGNFTSFVEEKKNHIKKQKKKINLFHLINIAKLDFIISFFINRYTLKIFYFLIFTVKNLLVVDRTKVNNVTFEKSVYPFNINAYLPHYFRKGMIEIQFSIKFFFLLRIINAIKNAQFSNSVFPMFFIVKKMEKIKNKYFFNFPKYNYSISLGYTKKQLLDNTIFFKKLYQIIFENKGNLYLTKDETVLDLNNKFKNKLKKRLKVAAFFSNDFYQKVFL